MRIVCVAANASSNSLVRLYPIAKVLERRHEVHLAGFRSGPEVFPPYAGEFDFHTLRARSLPGFVGQVREVARTLQADLLYAFKPLSTSLWPGLAARRRLDVPLWLDIEDWELGWYLDQNARAVARHALRLSDPNGIAWTAVNELLVRRAQHVTVASTFLQRRFGGTFLPHGPDTDLFDPARWPREKAIETLGLPDLRYLVFTGTPMPNKGLEDVLECLERIAASDVRLLVVGSFAHDPGFRDRLTERFGAHLTVVAPRPHAEMPLFLTVASAVVLAQQRTRETEAQMPAKVYEAMAMGRPVLATAVSDLPRVLDGCGVVVAPGDAAALEAGLRRLLDDRALGGRLGAAARKRCVEELGWDAMERVLETDLARLVRG